MGEPEGSRMTVKYDTEKIRISCQMTYARPRHTLIMLNNYRFSTQCYDRRTCALCFILSPCGQLAIWTSSPQYMMQKFYVLGSITSQLITTPLLQLYFRVRPILLEGPFGVSPDDITHSFSGNSRPQQKAGINKVSSCSLLPVGTSFSSYVGQNANLYPPKYMLSFQLLRT